MNKKHLHAEIGLIILFIIFSFIFAVNYPYFKHFYILITFFILLFGVRVYFEWKYERETKRYLISLNGVVWLNLLLMLFALFDLK
ncbi:DUF4181 domain-containing protein [Sediminibacillus massiliensis]|uniref:DUF4181 domain-containing protein n=1 Tax=Sediminibacillus massiliensis TaxID=1926277 RepID=UPI0015C35F15|nr:DUF4181 domain-containing protein [Sediminibacillus massiliensis]